jgi:superfamily II DNA or RNA helicase
MICAHSLAVGIALLQPAPPPPKPAAAEPDRTSQTAVAFRANAAKQFSPDANGPEIALSIILAPNFAAAWEKNAITVGAEVSLSGRRMLLSAIADSGAYRCDPRDAQIIEKLCAVNGGALPGMMSVPRDSMIELLTVLTGHPRVTFGRTPAVQIEAAAGTPPKLQIRQNEEAVTGELVLHVERPHTGTILAAKGGVWILRDTVLQPVVVGLPSAYAELFQKEITIPPAQAASFVTRELPLLRTFFSVDIDDNLRVAAQEQEPFAPKLAVAEPPPPRFAVQFEGSLTFLTARLEAVQGTKRTWVRSRDRSSLHRPEQAAIEKLRAAGFTEGRDDLFELRGERAIVRFFARDLPKLEQEWEVSIGARFEHVTRDLTRIEPRLEIRSSGESWFDLSIELASQTGDRFSAQELQRLLRAGQNSVRLRSGKTAVFDGGMLDELQEVLTDCAPEQRQPGKYRINQRYAPYLRAVASSQGVAIQGGAGDDSQLLQLERLEPVSLGSLETVLRPYQKIGVAWFNFLASNHLGGILADEMGLGKTVQTLAFLRQLPGSSLVVCPSSLVVNWQREAARFTPERRCLALTGPERAELFNELSTADLVITSYALLRRDAPLYGGTAFNAVVLDEAQHIKNPESQNAHAASSLRARHRFVLTGTPIENSLRDIWSIMQFVLPGYLGSKTDFKERYEEPIRTDPAGAQHRRLIQRLSPFVLRRKKESVAPELPKKIEQVAYCELTTQQRAVYSGLLSAAHQQLSESASPKRPAQARMLILTALLRLRQAVCDLRLLEVAEEQNRAQTAAAGAVSAKVELLRELLSEAIDGGHRVIVFSQFVKMLKILEADLQQNEIDYAYLDGQTPNRQEVVDRFQNGTAPVFLMSLKAGGVGLNVTAADTVIHFDPWWNPAVEAQATDRAHRIGQTKVVTSYKLIARDTVEEKILTLQERKRSLVDATMASEEPMMEGLSMDEIRSLFD